MVFPSLLRRKLVNHLPMSLSNLTVADLRQAEKLISRKQRLLVEVSQIDRQLGQLEHAAGGPTNGTSGASSTGGRGRRSTGGGGRRGELKAKIVNLLQGAGKDGLHVKEIVKRTGAKENNIRVWFYATGKKIKNIKQIAPATYRWEN